MADFTELKKEFSAVSEFLVALGDEKRQAIIIALLADRACEGVRVNDLREVTGLSRPAISHHLKLLKQVNLVDYRAEGTKNYYYLTHETKEIAKLQQLLAHVTQIMTEAEAK